MDNRDKTFQYNGRLIGFREMGSADGAPVFYFHGLPGSRIEAMVGDSPARERNLRLIAVDRPGFGLSEFQPDRRILDWPETVTALADYLQLKQFALIGVSGGGPYALACALTIPDRLSGVSVCCGVPSHSWLEKSSEDEVASHIRILLAQPTPSLTALGNLLKVVFNLPGGLKILRLPRRNLPTIDRDTLEMPEFREVFALNIREAFRGPIKGILHDVKLLTHDWGFEPAKITLPVRYWHGELDAVVPVEVVRRELASRPHAKVTYMPSDGHFSLVLKRIGVILDNLDTPEE